MMSVVSVRVDKRVKERLERSGIEVSKEVKKHLEDLAWQLELKERLKRWEKFLDDMPPSKQGYAARSVREDRESLILHLLQSSRWKSRVMHQH